jgi:hypothetical protein
MRVFFRALGFLDAAQAALAGYRFTSPNLTYRN